MKRIQTTSLLNKPEYIPTPAWLYAVIILATIITASLIILGGFYGN